MIFFPPQSGKSELISRRFPAYMLGRNPDLRILDCTHTGTLAESFNLDVQRILETPAYKNLFPRTRLPRAGERIVGGTQRRKQDYFEIVGYRGFLRSAGVGMKIAGHPADIGIADDLFGSWEDAMSPTIRQKIWDWFWNDFMTRLSKDAPVILTHTRWNQDDVAGRILRQMSEGIGDQWDILCLPSIHEGKPTHPNDPRKVGEPLWPAHKDLNELNTIKESNPSGFDALHQQNPRASGSVEWPDEYFENIFYDNLPDQPYRFRTMGLDPSMGKNAKSGDYPALLYCLVDHQLHLWVDDSLMRVMPSPMVEDTAVEMLRAKSPDGLIIEVNGFQELVAANIQRKAQAENVQAPIYTRNSTENKEVRIRMALSPLLAQHRIHFRNTLHNRIIVRQLQEFPVSDHDDGPDSLTLITYLINQFLTGRQTDKVTLRAG